MLRGFLEGVFRAARRLLRRLSPGRVPQRGGESSPKPDAVHPDSIYPLW